jgi:hypothetical protein
VPTLPGGGATRDAYTILRFGAGFRSGLCQYGLIRGEKRNVRRAKPSLRLSPQRRRSLRRFEPGHAIDRLRDGVADFDNPIVAPGTRQSGQAAVTENT